MVVVNLHGSGWACVVVSGPVWLWVGLRGSGWTCVIVMDLCGCGWAFMMVDLRGSGWTCVVVGRSCLSVGNT